MAGQPALFSLIASFAVVGMPAARELQGRGRTSAALGGESLPCSAPSSPRSAEPLDAKCGPGVREKGLAETKNGGVGTTVPSPPACTEKVRKARWRV